MRKTRSLPIQWGKAGNGLYCGSVSNGTKYAFCTLYKRCTPEGAAFLHATGKAQINAERVWSGSPSLEVLEDSSPSRGWWTIQPKFRPCSHKKPSHSVNYPISGIVLSSSTTASQFAFNRRPIVDVPVAAVEEHLSGDLSAAQSRAWHTMQPEFTGNISMINFLFELTEVRKLCADLIRTVMKLRSSWNKGWKMFDPSKPAAEQWLQFQFGIQPLIIDLVTIGQQLKDEVLAAQAKFALEGLDKQTRHYSEVWTEENTLPDLGIALGSTYSTKFTCTMDYRYYYNLRDPLEAMKRFWGLNLTAEAIWQALPFSFLADYFFAIGKAIAAMEHDERVTTMVLQYGESLKTERTYGWHFVGTERAGPVIIDESITSATTLISGCKATLYTRYLSSPNKGMAVPRIRIPKGKQYANMAALLRCFL